MLFLAILVLLLATGHCCEINCQQGGKHRNPQNRNSYIDCQNGKGFLVWCALSGDGFTRKTFNGKECIEPFACPRVSGKFRHPHNKDYYWNCENGLATLERCPNGLTFDGQSLCVERYECPELMGNFANSLNKSQYYECCYGEPTLHTCLKGFQFDSDLRCVETFVCPQSNGFFRNMRKENQYYECRDGEPIPRTCRPKHIFDGIDRCIEKFDCPLPEGNFVNRNDPSNRTYYLCRSGVATLVNCPHHYIFFGQECDEPFRCPRPDGRFSHPRNDTKYYMCDNNIAFPHACAPGLQFDDSKQTCLRPWLCPSAFGKFRHPDNTSLYYLCDNGRHRLVHCPAETTFDGQQCVPNYRCPESDGMFRHPTKENKYYYCRGGTPSLQECPIDYIYDELQRTCSPKDSVFVCPQPNGYFPHRYNEQIYYECEDGRPRVRQCTAQQRFDRRKQTCVDIRKPVLEFDCPRPDGLFADRTNESRFYHCRDGVPHLRDCGPNRRFDERVQNCVPVRPPYVCPEPEGIFAHPTNESRFYFCREDTPHLSECQSGQVFDPYHKTCVRPSDPPTPPVFRCPRPTGLFADPNSERRYYQCANSVPYLRECGYNQLFDARYQRCLDREQSGCQCPRPNGYFAYPYNKKRYLLCRQNVCEVRECATEEIFDSRSSRCVPTKIETGKCRQPNGLFRHETNSSRFYYCRNNRAELRECPVYQIFDEEVGGCIPWSWPNHFYCPLPNGLFTNPQNQSQYFECCSGRATLRSCPCKQIFNGQHCISEVVYQCEDNRPPHQCYNGQRYHYSCPYQYGRPELVYNGYRCVEPYHCPNSLGTQVIVNPVHNHQYYRCVNGQPTLNTCSRGYAYDPSRGCCVYEQRNVPGYNDYDARPQQPQQPPGPRRPTGSVGHTVPGVPVEESQVDPVYPDRRRPTYPDRDRPSYPAIVVPIQPESSYTVSSFLPTVAKPPEVIELEPQTEVITLPEAVAQRKDPQDDSVTRPTRGDIDDYANGESEPDDDEDDYNGNENGDKW